MRQVSFYPVFHLLLVRKDLSKFIFKWQISARALSALYEISPLDHKLNKLTTLEVVNRRVV